MAGRTRAGPGRTPWAKPDGAEAAPELARGGRARQPLGDRSLPMSLRKAGAAVVTAWSVGPAGGHWGGAHQRVAASSLVEIRGQRVEQDQGQRFEAHLREGEAAVAGEVGGTVTKAGAAPGAMRARRCRRTRGPALRSAVRPGPRSGARVDADREGKSGGMVWIVSRVPAPRGSTSRRRCVQAQLGSWRRSPSTWAQGEGVAMPGQPGGSRRTLKPSRPEEKLRTVRAWKPHRGRAYVSRCALGVLIVSVLTLISRGASMSWPSPPSLHPRLLPSDLRPLFPTLALPQLPETGSCRERRVTAST